MSNKKRMMLVLKYLQENTNEEHKVNSENIISELTKYDINVDRKTIYNDIATLNEMDFSIERESDGYYYDNEIFELAELRVLIDEMKSNSFLPENKTKVIIEKLLSLTNRYDRGLVYSNQKFTGKPDNKNILYNINTIIRAIDNKSAITFKYFYLDFTKKKIYKKSKYSVYPYDLVINSNRYYLIAKTFGHDTPSIYRLDRMENAEILDDEKFDVFPDTTDFMKKTFSMYAGETYDVTIKCKNNLFDEAENKFGSNLIITSHDDEYFIGNAKIDVSPTFFSWVFSFSGQITIIGPEKVKKEFAEACQKMYNMHK